MADRVADLRETQKAQTRALLLKNSWALFATQGYAETTVAQIARVSGASRATFYLHFSAKWETVGELLQVRLMPETLDYYRRLDALGSPSRAELRTWLDDALDFYDRHESELAIWRQATAMEPDLARVQAEGMSAIVQVMPGFLRRFGPDRRDEARLRVSLLVTQLTDFAIDWTSGHWDFRRDTLLDVLLDFWIAGMRAPVTAHV